MERECQHCQETTFYSCVKCQHPVCNRPECSTSVPPSTNGYNEEHPKRVALCRNCKSTKKKQSSVTSYFLKRYAFLKNRLLV